MLHQPGRPMVVFSQKTKQFSGKAAQHGRPLQTPLVSLIKLIVVYTFEEPFDNDGFVSKRRSIATLNTEA